MERVRISNWIATGVVALASLLGGVLLWFTTDENPDRFVDAMVLYAVLVSDVLLVVALFRWLWAAVSKAILSEHPLAARWSGDGQGGWTLMVD